jgi:hypothetical protein
MLIYHLTFPGSGGTLVAALYVLASQNSTGYGLAFPVLGAMGMAQQQILPLALLSYHIV